MDIQQFLRNLPKLPGVYIFKDSQNTILYVGKAKSLKHRVSSYFKKQEYDWKIRELIREYFTIEHIVTHTEAEALLLEAQMIRDFQPKYNVLLKSGNPFLFLLFNHDLKIVRVKKEKGRYFGPFLQKKEARAVFDYLTRTFKLRKCTIKIPQGCLEYHLGNCPGSCMPTYNPEDHKVRLELAYQALKGNHKQFLKTVEQQIQHYNQQLDFEKARNLSNYLKNLDIIFTTIKTRFTEKKYSEEIIATTSSLKRDPEALAQGLIELQQLLQLPEKPKTIDCFDISHFQSSYIVGSCIRFTDGKPDKDKFRRFKIRSLTIQNDYAALQEIVSRRYREGDVSDIILIDGGKGQLSAVQKVLPNSQCISLAKREETLFSRQFPDGVKLDLTTDMGQLLIALRDYAHHFAITYHKLLRKKAVRTDHA